MSGQLEGELCSGFGNGWDPELEGVVFRDCMDADSEIL
jgi:hypothetical protein